MPAKRSARLHNRILARHLQIRVSKAKRNNESETRGPRRNKSEAVISNSRATLRTRWLRSTSERIFYEFFVFVSHAFVRVARKAVGPAVATLCPLRTRWLRSTTERIFHGCFAFVSHALAGLPRNAVGPAAAALDLGPHVLSPHRRLAGRRRRERALLAQPRAKKGRGYPWLAVRAGARRICIFRSRFGRWRFRLRYRRT
jgi:hypothetical protein